MENLVTWFEIPVKDVDRAMEFYTAVFGFEFHRAQDGAQQWAFFPFPEHRAGGSLTLAEGYEPGSDGPIIFLYAGQDLREPLSRVEAAGGRVVRGRTSVGEHGFVAWIQDTEGNRIGMHSEF